MIEVNPLLLTGAVIGTITALLTAAYVLVKDKKSQMGFERTMKDGEIMHRLVAYAKPYWKQFVLVLFLMMFSIAYDIISPLIIGNIEELVAGDFVLPALYARVGGYVVVLLFSMGSTYLQAVILQRVGQRIVSDLREDLFTHIESLSHEQLNEIPVGKLVTRVTNDTNAISMMFTNLLVSLTKNAFVIVGILIAMICLNYELTLMVLCFVPFIVIFTVIFRKFSRRAYRRVKDATTDINTYLSENLSGIKVTQIFGREEEKMAEFREKSQTQAKANLSQIFVFSVFRPLVYMLYICSVLCLFYLGNAIFSFPFTNDVVNAADIALVHSIFNVFTTLVLLPFTKGLEKLAYLTIPKTEDEKKTANDAFVILDDRFLSSPAFAIEQCRSLVSQMAEMTRDGFLEAMDVLGEYSEEKAQDVIDKENRVDVYDDKITAYLTKLSSENLSYKDSLQVTSLLHCITDFERISDHSINVVESVQQMRKENLTFSRKGEEEMNLYGAAIRDILTRTTDAFVNNDQALAHTVEPLEEVIDELNKDVKKHHMKRLRKGKCSMELGLLLSDLAMNYERVADHCSNIAVYMMQLKDTQLEEHSFTEQLDEAESAEFTRLLDEFGSKYAL